MKARDLLELLDGRLALAFQVLAAVLKVKGYEPELYLGIFKCILGLTAPDAYFQDDDAGDGEEIALGAFSDKISDVMHILLSTDFPTVIVDAVQRCCGFKEPRRMSKRAPTLEARYAQAQGPVGKSAGSAAKVKINVIGHEIVAVACQFMECGELKFKGAVMNFARASQGNITVCLFAEHEAGKVSSTRTQNLLFGFCRFRFPPKLIPATVPTAYVCCRSGI